MYKYISFSEQTNQIPNMKGYFNTNQKKDENQRIKKYQQDCNPIEGLTRQDEGGVIDGWTLQGVLLIIRHGDRGPMAHVRGINLINCSAHDEPILNKYRNFLSNYTTSAQSGFGHATWMKTGPFHGMALFPPSSNTCLLGQMTSRGIAQLLHIGDILRQSYGHPLGLLINKINVPPIKSSSTTNNTSGHIESPYNTEEIVIYSTRYRRTFQSAMSLMFGFIPVHRWGSLYVQESHSLAFCFSDCACPQADTLKKVLSKQAVQLLAQHPAVVSVVQWVGTSLLQNPIEPLNPLEVRDAVLSIICHDAPLPCHKQVKKEQVASTAATSTTDADISDVINIDQEDGGGKINVQSQNTVEPDDLVAEPEPEGCVEQSHVAALMSYTHWQGLKENRNKFSRRAGLLRAYGLIRNIVNYMLKMVSGDKTKFVLYSGHDRTLQYILGALGPHLDNPFIPYAARLSFEVYKSDKDTQFYFRLLYNGHDITRQIEFCEGGKSLRVNRGSRGNKADLCPIENIIRFIHDDYFLSLNATNYKDACTIVQKDSEF